MDRKRFDSNAPGKLVKATNAKNQEDWAFIADELQSPVTFDSSLWSQVANARDALGTLNAMGRELPNPQLLLRPLQQREAISSSKIEGTYVTAEQLLLLELDPPDPQDTNTASADWTEVFNYSNALQHGWCRIVEDKLPFCHRMIREMHEILMRGVRGQYKSPGNYRKIYAQVGSTARFVPAPWREIERLMDNLEKYINTHEDDPSLRLLKCFIVHYQFEAIHPFEDGNGRVGRALLALMISQFLGHSMPWIYLSAFFEEYRDEYVDKLFKVSSRGQWTEWLEFCLGATIAQAEDSSARITTLKRLKVTFHERVTATARSHEIVESLFSHPLLTAVSIRDQFKVSYNTARRDLERLVEDKILEELPSPNSGVMTFFAPEVMRCAFGARSGDSREGEGIEAAVIA